VDEGGGWRQLTADLGVCDELHESRGDGGCGDGFGIRRRDRRLGEGVGVGAGGKRAASLGGGEAGGASGGDFLEGRADELPWEGNGFLFGESQDGLEEVVVGRATGTHRDALFDEFPVEVERPCEFVPAEDLASEGMGGREIG
jgi:hypothetical protein